MFIGQSKIYSYLNPNKTPGARPPLQEENSVMYHEVKCQGKTLNETYRKGDGKIDLWIACLIKCAPSTPSLKTSIHGQEGQAAPLTQLLSQSYNSVGRLGLYKDKGVLVLFKTQVIGLPGNFPLFFV